MKKLYKNKYRIDSHRMPEWDYSRNGKYFVTICVKDMRCILGKVVNKKMILSDFGKIVEEQWFRSFEIRKELFYDEFIIMPNHLHAILIINHPHTNNELIENGVINEEQSKMMRFPKEGKSNSLKAVRQPKSISSFFAGFKSACYSPIDDLIDIHNELVFEREQRILQVRMNTKEYVIYNLPLNQRKFYKKYNRHHRIWQTNYHDHIIRNDGEFKRIKDYIINNPANWKGDVFYNKRRR